MLVRKAPSHCSRWREKILAVLGLGRTKVRPLQRRGATAPPARCEEGNGAEQDSPRGAEQDEAVAALDAGAEAAGGGNDAEEHGRGYRVEQTFSAAGDYEGAGHFWVALAELPCGEHGHHGGGYAEPGVDGNDLRQREHGEGRVDCARDNDRKDGRAVARVNASESAREESVLGESEGHSRGGEHGAVDQSSICDHGGEGEPGAEKGSADEPCGNGKVICVPVLPVAQRGEGSKGRKEIGGYGERDDQG